MKEDKNTIITVFLNKLKSISFGNKKIIELIYRLEELEEPNIDIFIQIINQYRYKCEDECFGGWANTPGYYLLSSIDYNEYFRELEIIKQYDTIDGLYIENDQDEIVMFNLENIIKTQVNFILPYQLRNFSNEVHVNFIERYIDNFKNNQIDDLLEQMYQFNIVYNEVEWDFNYFHTPCFNYDPYISIETNCAKDMQCKVRRGSIDDNYQWAMVQGKGCDFKSHKLSLSDMNNINDFKKYVKFIKTCNFNHLLELCNNITTIDEIARIQFIS